MITARVYNIQWTKESLSIQKVKGIPSSINVEIDEDSLDLEDEDDEDLMKFLSDKITGLTGMSHEGFEYELKSLKKKTI